MDLGPLPVVLRAQAVPLGGEFAWPPAVARAVIEFLQEQSIAVIGVEIWLPEGASPRVLGWSGYDVLFTGDWDAFVLENAVHALSHVSKQVPENTVFNLTWIDREDLDRLDAAHVALQSQWPREPPGGALG